jgi:ATP-binding cassette subfamily F protein 3
MIGFVDNNKSKNFTEVTMGSIYDYKAKYSHYLELRKDHACINKKHMMNNMISRQ